MPVPLLVGIASLFGPIVAKFFTARVLFWGALKIFILGLFTTVLPTIIYKFITKYMIDCLNIFVDKTGSSCGSSLTIDLVGVGAYLAGQTGIPECLAILMSAVVLKFTLKMIPVIGSRF